MTVLTSFLFLIVANTALAGEPFNWDRYHAQRHACTEADHIAMECVRGYCDELALRRAKRACSTFTDQVPGRP